MPQIMRFWGVPPPGEEDSGAPHTRLKGFGGNSPKMGEFGVPLPQNKRVLGFPRPTF